MFINISIFKKLKINYIVLVVVIKYVNVNKVKVNNNVVYFEVN